MLEIKEYDEIINNEGKEHDPATFNGKLFGAYRNSQDAEYEMLDFNDILHNKDIEQIPELLRKFAITEFTISSTWSGLIERLALLEEKGLKIQGITKIYNSRQEKEIPAILMKVE